MSNYYSVYQSRINHLGESTAERIRNGGIRSFYKWMAESPHTVRQLSVERGIYFDGIILTSKDKEYEKIMFLNVANDIPLKVGDIMNWTLDDKSIEKWIIVQEEKKVNGTYRTFWIIRCNYLLKWIDNDGHLLQSWAYVVSSVDSKIKGNYRTWNALITPQPNKYAEILMPYYPIDRATNFIVQDESWHTIECDFTSVPGTIYISLTENKVNLIYDDLVEDIADIDRRAKYTLQVAEDSQHVSVSNEPLKLHFTLSKNGIPYTEETQPELIYSVAQCSEQYLKVKDNQVYALAAGEAVLLVKVAKDTEMTPLEYNLIINETPLMNYYIEGPDKIRLDRIGRYYLKPNLYNEQPFNKSIKPIWTLQDLTNDNGEVPIAAEKLMQIMTVYKCDDLTNEYILDEENNKIELFDTIEIKANDKNYLWKALLIASVEGQIAQKEIQIIPIW